MFSNQWTKNNNLSVSTDLCKCMEEYLGEKILRDHVITFNHVIPHIHIYFKENNQRKL